MRRQPAMRILLLALLLGMSHVVFASHLAAHVDVPIAGCEFCVCQGQTPAGPLPHVEQSSAERLSGPSPSTAPMVLPAQPNALAFQPRAPPVVA